MEQIKERLSILDVVSPYVKLTRAGKHYKGLSPFTKEKTPSFFVSLERGLYHCFSSGKGGDMFTFIQEMEGVDFRGALTLLAEKAGVEVAQEPAGARDRREKLHEVLKDAVAVFEKNLLTTPDVVTYLHSRGLSDETIASWQVGYALPEWRALSEALVARGHDEAVLVEAGLTKHPEREGEALKKPYDRFRGRIMFPIRDVSGRTVGFSGRTFADVDPSSSAKYINSPETPVFDKSRILYGLDRAKEGIRKYGFAILVEGQVDLLMAHQAKYVNTVALSGTGFTEGHAALLKRYTENLVIAFDGDRAGVSAAGRAAQIALRASLNVKLATMPPGEDPADVLKRDVGVWKDAVREASHVVDFYLDYLRASGFDDRRFKLEVSRVVLPYVADIRNAIDQAHFVSRVADVLGVPARAVEIELEKIRTPHVAQHRGAPAATRSPGDPATPFEPFMSREDTLERLLFGLSESLKEGEYAPLALYLERELTSLLGTERLQELASSSDGRRVALIEGDLFLEAHGAVRDRQALLDELLTDFKKELHRRRYRDALRVLSHAEKEGNEERVAEALALVSELARGL